MSNHPTTPQGSADRAEELRALSDYGLGGLHAAWVARLAKARRREVPNIHRRIDACDAEWDRRCAEREAQEAELGRLQEQFDDLEAFLRSSWNSAHAQHDLASSEGLKREYDGRIAAIEQVADRLRIQLTEASEGQEGDRG